MEHRIFILSRRVIRVAEKELNRSSHSGIEVALVAAIYEDIGERECLSDILAERFACFLFISLAEPFCVCPVVLMSHRTVRLRDFNRQVRQPVVAGRVDGHHDKVVSVDQAQRLDFSGMLQ